MKGVPLGVLPLLYRVLSGWLLEFAWRPRADAWLVMQIPCALYCLLCFECSGSFSLLAALFLGGKFVIACFYAAWRRDEGLANHVLGWVSLCISRSGRPRVFRVG